MNIIIYKYDRKFIYKALLWIVLYFIFCSYSLYILYEYAYKNKERITTFIHPFIKINGNENENTLNNIRELG